MSAKSEKAAEIAAETVEVVEETAATLERIPKLALNGTTKQQQILILSFTALAGAAAATAVCVTVFKKRYQAKYEKIADEQIAEARDFFQAIHDKPDLSDLADEVRENDEAKKGLDAAASAFKSYQSGKLPFVGEQNVIVGVPEETHNIFVEGLPMDDNFDYEAEVASRTLTEPYIISKSEYDAGEKEYDQEELTYYEGDDTLADSKGKHIPDQDETVGDMNLHRFGHGSGDNNVLYVRNDRLELDFVVLKSTGEYAKEVLGLRHADGSGSRKRPKARWGDDE